MVGGDPAGFLNLLLGSLLRLLGGVCGCRLCLIQQPGLSGLHLCSEEELPGCRYSCHPFCFLFSSFSLLVCLSGLSLSLLGRSLFSLLGLFCFLGHSLGLFGLSSFCGFYSRLLFFLCIFCCLVCLFGLCHPPGLLGRLSLRRGHWLSGLLPGLRVSVSELVVSFRWETLFPGTGGGGGFAAKPAAVRLLSS